jgi:PAS domain S-box-containing protein
MAELHVLPSAPPIEKGLFDLVPCGLVVCDSTGNVLRLNAFFRQISGLPAAAFSEGRAFHHYLTRPSRFVFNAQVLPQLLVAGEVREIALDIEGPKRTGVPVLLNATHDKASGQLHFALFPAGERREQERQILKAQNELTRNRDYLQLAEKLAHVGHWHLDLQTRKCYWSPEIYAIHGLDPENFDPNLDAGIDLYHPDDRAEVTDILGQAIADGSEFTFCKRLLRPDGEVRRVECQGVCERNGRGVVTGLFGVFQDITDAVRAQEEMALSEHRYRLLADNANDIITVFDLAGRFKYLSPAVSRVLGYEPADLIGRNVRSIIHPNDFEPTLDAYRAYATGGDWSCTPRIQYRAVHKEGRLIWLEAHPRAILDDSGLITGFHDTVRDIDQQKAIEKALAKASREARAAADAKAQFLATMSHELRTPLTSIIGYSSLLRDLLDETDGNRRHAQRIHGAGQGLLALINDILDHSKLEAGQLELDIEPCAVGCLVRDVIDLLTLQADAKGLDLTLTGALNEDLMVDEPRLRQILMNLISNAVKFTEKGTVTVHMERRSERLYLAVSDTGPGISKAGQAHLFQRFSQVDKAANHAGGTGLGLLICKQLTELMGGQIGVISEVGKGSTFWFEIPAVTSMESQHEDR